MKALIVGLGSIGQRHVRNLRLLAGRELEIIAARSKRQAPLLSDTLEVVKGGVIEDAHGIRSFSSLDAALAERPDMAFICNPSALHVPAALACAKAGCHLFVEKPLGAGLDGVEELARTLEAKGRVGYVGYNMRFHPGVTRLQELLAAGTVGKVVAVNAHVGEYMPGFHKYEDYRDTYPARKDLGGGVILSQIHELDYLYALFGAPKTVYARGGHLSDLEIDVEDVASILMEYEVGGRAIPVHLYQDFLQAPPQKFCQVIGDKGRVTVDFINLTVTIVELASGASRVQSFAGAWKRNDMFVAQMQHFLDCVAGKATPKVTIMDGAASLKTALLAKESLATGRALGWR